MKVLIKSIVFIGIFCGLFINISYILRHNSDMKERFMGFYAEESGTIDMIMIGSSAVSSYWAAPMAYNEFGITTYPLSTNSQYSKAMKYVIREAEKSQSPKLYVCEMRMFTLTQEWLDNNRGEAFIRNLTDNLKYSANRISLINDMVSSEESRLPYYFDIMKYHSNWKDCLRVNLYGGGVILRRKIA